MRISFSAIRQFVDFQGSAPDCAEVLSDLGFPNDGVFARAQNWEGIVVGQIKERAKHPQADRLSLLRVDVGDQTLPIVCGADNMKEGDYVAVAKVGTWIPGKDGEGLKIKKSKIRGEVSEGMCCSEEELGMAEASEGIWILPKKKVESSLGQPVAEVLELADWILDLDITPNRGDALCARGLARELAAKTDRKLKNPVLYRWKEDAAWLRPTIESYEDAYGFAACLVRGVKDQPSPFEWQRFLQGFGARSVSGLVDVTNVVLFELGHPLHFFDGDKIDPKSIGVRRAKEGESLELLNGETIELHPEDLVIADQSGPLSLAGVMGGRASAISPDTKNLLVEVASFNPAMIRASAQRHGISSESSYRFERGIPPFRLEEVMGRALALLQELCGFETAVGSKQVDRNIKRVECLWKRDRIEAKLGKLSYTDNQLFDWLRRLEYEFEVKGGTPRVIFPWYRRDVSELEDLMEDVARLIGYENLQQKPMQAQESVAVIGDLRRSLGFGESLLDSFVHHGFVECVHPSFSSAQMEGDFIDSKTKWVELQNPIHSEQSVMRRCLVPQLISRAKENAFHSEHGIRFVEVGPIFEVEGSSDYRESPIAERWHIACVWYPRPLDEKVLWKNQVDALFEFKGLLDHIFSGYQMVREGLLSSSVFHPNRYFAVAGAYAGEIHPALVKKWGLRGRVFAGEWDLRLEAQPKQYELPAVYPPIDLDVSFRISKNLRVQQLIEYVQKHRPKTLEWFRPYDLFESSELGDSERSVTFLMRYRDPERTLALEEAKSEHEALTKALLEAFESERIALR